jgi:hypothetical protein
MNKTGTDSLSRLWGDITLRLRGPARSVTFYSHLIISVIVGGGLGVWHYLHAVSFGEEIFKASILSTALFTYFPSIVAAAYLETAQEKQPYWRAFGQLFAFVFLILFISCVSSTGRTQLAVSALATILAVFTWWIVNGQKDYFSDIAPESSVNNPTDTPLSSNPKIKINDFEH